MSLLRVFYSSQISGMQGKQSGQADGCRARSAWQQSFFNAYCKLFLMIIVSQWTFWKHTSLHIVKYFRILYIIFKIQKSIELSLKKD